MVAVVRQALRFDRSGIDVRHAVRCTIGVAAVLGLGLAANDLLGAVSAAFGAMSSGFASRQGVYRTRAAAMLLTTAAMAFSVFVGGKVGPHPAAAIAALFVWGLAFGLLGSLGMSATIVGLNAAIGLIVFGHPPYVPDVALREAGWVVGGGLLQTALLVLVWPLQRFRKERTVLASAFGSLAAYARRFGSAGLESPETQPLLTVSGTLADAQPFARRSELVGFTALLRAAEGLRGAFAALALDRHLLAGDRDAGAALEAVVTATVPILSEIAAAIDEGRGPAPCDPEWHAAGLGAAALERAPGLGHRQAAADARDLLARLRAAWTEAQAPAERTGATPAVPDLERPFALSAIGEAALTLLANCSPHSVYARHAVRAGITLALAGVLEHVVPLQRSYWIAMTVVLVLRPDYTTTFTRGVARVLGTVAGAILAGAITAGLHPDPRIELVLAIVFAWFGYALVGANYAAFSVTITGYVIFLLAFAGSPEHLSAVDRVYATMIGGALAMAAYAVWPSWSRERVADALADLIDAQRRYVVRVLGAYLDPRGRDAAGIRAAQRDAWRARTAAEAAVQQLAAEPVRARGVDEDAGAAFLAASKRLRVGALTLEARSSRADGVARDALAPFAGALDAAFGAICTALREGEPPPRSFPALRERQQALKAALDREPSPAMAGLVAETDLLAQSVAEMAAALSAPRP